MITKISTKNFKGRNLNQDIGPKTIFMGPNGSGKSANSQALTLALLGYVPGSAKTNAEILKAFGTEGKDLWFGFNLNGIHFERGFSMSKKGIVSEVFKIDNKKASKDKFLSQLAESGSPKILDLSTFLNLSDQKKIDMIFSLFPPVEDVEKLDAEIETLQTNINARHSDIRTAEGVIKNLTKSKAEINLPPGTLAEVTAEIEKIKAEYRKADQELKAAEIKQAEDKAAADAKAKLEAEAKAKAEEAANKALEPARQQAEAKLTAKNQRMGLVPEQNLMSTAGPVPRAALVEANAAAESITKILNALNAAKCSTCAASMIAAIELKKFKGVAV